MSSVVDLRERITRLFVSSMHIDVPTVDTELFETGVLDSLAFVELLLLLRSEFGVTASVDDMEIENFSSIGRIATFVASRIGTPSGVAVDLPEH